MAVNNKPIFTGTLDLQLGRFLTGALITVSANSFTTPTLSDFYLAFTANATYGSYIQRIRFKVNGTGTTNPTVIKVAILSSNSSNISTKPALFDEVYIPSLTLSATSASPAYELPMNLALAPGNLIYLGWTTSAGNAIDYTVIGGHYSA